MNPGILLQDSIVNNTTTEEIHYSTTVNELAGSDTIISIKHVESAPDTLSVRSIDSVHRKVLKSINDENGTYRFQTSSAHFNNDTIAINLIQTNESVPDKYVNPPINRFSLSGTDHSTIQYKPEEFWTGQLSYNNTSGALNYIPHIYQRSEFNWTLIVGFISVLLLLGLTTYYKKFVNQVMITLVNFQLADKMLREKNIIVRRAFFMMNLNFILMFSMFLLLIANYINIRITQSYYIDYIIILAITLMILLARLFILKLTGIIFDTSQAFSEQIHNNYLINKNLGLILLPLVFTAIYTAPLISKIIIIAGIILLTLATIYKLIRGFQIILRNGVLLYYAILYLCTLELLPLAIGSKILISLR